MKLLSTLNMDLRQNPLLQVSLLIFVLLFLSSPSFISFTQSKVPRLGTSPKTFQYTCDDDEILNSNSDLNSHLKFFYFDQNLDHFTYKRESYTTFHQRYAIDFKYWGGAKAKAPIFAYLGEETSIDNDLRSRDFLRDNGFQFKALLVYMEHRYYGKSMPFGSAKEALRNASTLGYFNSAQALADYAAILLHIKDKYSPKHCPIVVFGGSYGGMLAAWFRLKYPHVAIGALASSAPLLYFVDTPPKHGYYFIVTKSFKETSEECYKIIRKSWDEIDRLAAKPNGLYLLSQKFKTCNRLKDSFELKDYLDSIYATVAQYNRPDSRYSVNAICDAITGAPKGTDLLGRIFAGVVKVIGNSSCYDSKVFNRPTNASLGWRWQTCSEMVMPIGHDKEDTMFQTAPFNLASFINKCQFMYGVPPRPHWITTYYGGQDFKLILRRFGSNIIFSNGLLDPYSVGGIIENVSDSIVAFTTKKGSHCLDINPSNKGDPDWLVMQREQEVNIIENWIFQYHKDFGETKM